VTVNIGSNNAAIVARFCAIAMPAGALESTNSIESI
jgi:hypothetical protein